MRYEVQYRLSTFVCTRWPYPKHLEENIREILDMGGTILSVTFDTHEREA